MKQKLLTQGKVKVKRTFVILPVITMDDYRVFCDYVYYIYNPYTSIMYYFANPPLGAKVGDIIDFDDLFPRPASPASYTRN